MKIWKFTLGLALLGGCAAPSQAPKSPPVEAAVAPVPKPTTVPAVVSFAPAPKPVSPAKAKSVAVRPVATAKPTSGDASVKGFDEYERRAIFREIVEGEDGASADAEKNFPDIASVAYINEVNRLEEKSHAEIKRRYRLSARQFELLSIEGVTHKWPPLGE